jgi:hypothetical protein
LNSTDQLAYPHARRPRALEEVEVPHGAAELAVGHGLEADLLLVCHELRDALVFDLRELGIVDGAGGVVRAGLLEGGWAQEAADDVVGVGRLGGQGHGLSSRGAAMTGRSPRAGSRAVLTNLADA